MSEHTPGPWRLNKHAELAVENEVGRGVCSTGGYQDNFSDGAYFLENQANARLISAAPELLGALEALWMWTKNWDAPMMDDDEFPRSQIEAAIAKARDAS